MTLETSDLLLYVTKFSIGLSVCKLLGGPHTHTHTHVQAEDTHRHIHRQTDTHTHTHTHTLTLTLRPFYKSCFYAKMQKQD